MTEQEMHSLKIIIASSLHDIGKLLWRGGFQRINFDYSVAHAQHLRDVLLFPDQYIATNQSTGAREKFVGITDVFWKDVAYIGSLHHKKDQSEYYNKVFDYVTDKNQIELRKKLVSIVYVSDNIASLDRLYKENSIDEKENEKESSIKTTGLGSIFENIFVESPAKNKFFYSKDTLENIKPLSGEINTDFKILAVKFYQELINLLNQNVTIYKKDEREGKKFIYQLDLLLQRYFSLVPSDSSQGLTQDLSLYDHSKIVVAIASILYKKFINEEKINLGINTSDVQNRKISLIAGDFPSIQKYIFEGMKKQKGLSKRLRTRSFRVAMLNEAVIEFLLSKLGYTRANVLINAGGKFVLMVDEGADISDLKSNINTFLLAHFPDIRLSLIKQDKCIGEVFASDSEENFNLKTVKETFVELFETLSRDKFQIYQAKNLKELFMEKNISGKILCKYCGQNYFKSENDENYVDDDSSHQTDKCKICDWELKLGEQLVKQSSIYLNYRDEKGNFDFREDFHQGQLKILFNQWDYLLAKQELSIGKSINLYVPHSESGETKSFEQIIESDQNGKKGLKYLCMLKGDVDNMSLIFKHGFDTKNDHTIYSVNRLVQFSRFLELFFGNYLQQKIESTPQFQNVYTVFSGGDDFIFIIPFHVRQSFIQFLNQEFYAFTSHNAKIHFSTGLGIFKEKTPFKYMDDTTESLLKSAKLHAKKQKEITTKGHAFYLPHFAIIEKSKEMQSINLLSPITTWSKQWKPIERQDSYHQTQIDSVELCIQDTQTYRLYSELTKAKEALESQDYAIFILIGARIINMFARNSETTKKLGGFQNMQQNIVHLIQDFRGNNEDKIEQINQILLGLVDSMYLERYSPTAIIY